MTKLMLGTFCLALLTLLAGCGGEGPPRADLVLVNGNVITMDSAGTRAQAVAIRGDRIVAVGEESGIRDLADGNTRVMDLQGRTVMPGFIDNHTHFSSAGNLLLGVKLLQVSDAEGLAREVRAAVDRMPDGAWLTGGDWGAYEQWAQDSEGGGQVRPDSSQPFRPHRGMIDSLTAQHPALLSKWDGSAYLANGLALDAAGADCSWSGVECVEGGMTGRLDPQAAQRIREVIPEKTMEHRLAEARIAQRRLASHGVTTIHDITGPQQMKVFRELHRRGELTVRVYMRPTLDKWDELAAVGIEHGFGNEWLKIGGLKGFVDGIMGNSSARFYEPYLTSGERGRWRDMMYPPGNMLELLLGADRNGHWPQVHAIGDQAIDSLLTLYERVIEENGPKDRRFRLIHTQVLSGPEAAERMAGMGITAEVQPYHTIDDMRWMEERIGERSRWAYAFKTLENAGVLLSFGSDWPGTNASWYTSDPLLGMYAAVTRQTLDGMPEGGWYPEERVSMETAMRAYTVNNAWAAGEEDLKGRIAPGMLADLVVLSRDISQIDPAELPDTEAVTTIVGGKVVYERE